MLKQIPLKEAIGKTLIDVESSRDGASALLLFSDDSFVSLSATISGYEDDHYAQLLSSKTFYEEDYRDEILIRFGFYKVEELREKKALAEAKERDRTIRNEKLQLELLKAKYEGGGSN